MLYPVPLTLFVIGFCLFIVFYVVSSFLYSKRHETKYHFYNMFPYEFNFPSVFKNNLYGNILLIVSCLAIMAFYEFSSFSDIYSMVTIVLSILQTMLIILLILLPLKYLRTHIVVSVLSMVFSMALSAFNLLIALNQMKIATSDIVKFVSIISMVIAVFLAVSMLVLILNPRMTFKIYAEKKIDENGNEVLHRPKVIAVALSEWWSIFVYFLSPLPILLLLFFI